MPKDYSISSLHPRNTRSKWTPPFQKLPRWEAKFFWPVFMFCGIMAVPGWILYHLPDYRGGVGPHVLYIKKQQREAAAAEAAAAAAAEKV